MKKRTVFLTPLLLTLLPNLASASTSYYLETGQTGAEVTISVTGSESWTFTPTWGWSLGGGILTMKEGTSTSASITLTLNDITDSVADVAQVTVPSGNDGGPFTQSYSPIDFFFSSAVTLTPNVTYDLVLSSPALTTNSTEYFLKDDGSSSFDDLLGNALPSSAPTPEPGTISLLALGCSLLLFRVAKARSTVADANNTDLN